MRRTHSMHEDVEPNAFTSLTVGMASPLPSHVPSNQADTAISPQLNSLPPPPGLAITEPVELNRLLPSLVSFVFILSIVSRWKGISCRQTTRVKSCRCHLRALPPVACQSPAQAQLQTHCYDLILLVLSLMRCLQVINPAPLPSCIPIQVCVVSRLGLPTLPPPPYVVSPPGLSLQCLPWLCTLGAGSWSYPTTGCWNGTTSASWCHALPFQASRFILQVSNGTAEAKNGKSDDVR